MVPLSRSGRDGQASGVGDGLVEIFFAIGAGNAFPINCELFGIVFSIEAGFAVGKAHGVEERIGHEGECGGAGKADAVLASQFDDGGDESTDVFDLGGAGDLGGEFVGKRAGAGRKQRKKRRASFLRRGDGRFE